MRSTTARGLIRGAARPGTEGSRDDGVGLRDVVGEHVGLLLLLFVRQLACIASGALGRDARVDELAAQRLDLLTCCRAHVVGLYDRA
jgi:hypothetical protein